MDDRLIYGQVAVIWTKELNVPLLAITNDEAAKNEAIQVTLEMIIPNGTKLLIRPVDDAIDVFSDPHGKDKRISAITNSIADATKIVKNVTDIENVDVTSASRFDRSGPVTKAMVLPSVQLNPEELGTVKEPAGLTHAESYNQILPASSKLSLKQAVN